MMKKEAFVGLLFVGGDLNVVMLWCLSFFGFAWVNFRGDSV